MFVCFHLRMYAIVNCIQVRIQFQTWLLFIEHRCNRAFIIRKVFAGLKQGHVSISHSISSNRLCKRTWPLTMRTMLTSRVAIANNNYLFSTTFPGLSIYELFVCTKSLLRFMEIRSHLTYLCIYYVYALYTVLTTFIRKVYKHNATYMYFNCKYTCRLILSLFVAIKNLH